MKRIPKQEYTAEFKEQAVKHAQAVGCHRPAHRSQLMIGTMEPARDRHIGASHGSAHRSQRRVGVMEPVMF
jgi:hypothetical protein